MQRRGVVSRKPEKITKSVGAFVFFVGFGSGTDFAINGFEGDANCHSDAS